MIVVGCIGRPFGVKGWVHIISYTEPLDAILEYQPWFIQIHNEWKAVSPDGLITHVNGGGQIRAQFVGCDTIEVARTYTNFLIGVEREQLPVLDSEEYYWSDLEGLEVINQASENLGKVSHLFSTGANDVIVVRGERERLLPYIKAVVLKVDLAEKKIYVDWESEF